MSKIRPPSPDDKSKDRRTYAQRIEERFPAICADLARQYAAGECTLHQAVDWMQDWAFTRGLVELIGQDQVQWIMAKELLPYREDLAK